MQAELYKEALNWESMDKDWDYVQTISNVKGQVCHNSVVLKAITNCLKTTEKRSFIANMDKMYPSIKEEVLKVYTNAGQVVSEMTREIDEMLDPNLEKNDPSMMFLLAAHVGEDVDKEWLADIQKNFNAQKQTVEQRQAAMDARLKEEQRALNK